MPFLDDELLWAAPAPPMEVEADILPMSMTSLVSLDGGLWPLRLPEPADRNLDLKRNLRQRTLELPAAAAAVIFPLSFIRSVAPPRGEAERLLEDVAF